MENLKWPLSQKIRKMFVIFSGIFLFSLSIITHAALPDGFQINEDEYQIGEDNEVVFIIYEGLFSPVDFSNDWFLTLDGPDNFSLDLFRDDLQETQTDLNGVENFPAWSFDLPEQEGEYQVTLKNDDDPDDVSEDNFRVLAEEGNILLKPSSFNLNGTEYSLGTDHAKITFYRENFFFPGEEPVKLIIPENWKLEIDSDEVDLTLADEANLTYTFELPNEVGEYEVTLKNNLGVEVYSKDISIKNELIEILNEIDFFTLSSNDVLNGEDFEINTFSRLGEVGMPKDLNEDYQFVLENNNDELEFKPNKIDTGVYRYSIDASGEFMIKLYKEDVLVDSKAISVVEDIEYLPLPLDFKPNADTECDDVSQNFWAYDLIDELIENSQYPVKYQEGEVLCQPNTQLTRKEFTAWQLYVYHDDLPELLSDAYELENPFQDLREEDPYYPYVLAAFDLGIINGDTLADGTLAGTFRPNDPISRAELIKIAIEAGNLFLPTQVNIDELRAENPQLRPENMFADVKTSDVNKWWYGYLIFETNNGIIEGRQRINPNGTISQVAEMSDGVLFSEAAKIFKFNREL